MPHKYDVWLLLSFLCQHQKIIIIENDIVIEAICIGNRGNLSLGMEIFEVHATSKIDVGFGFLGFVLFLLSECLCTCHNAFM